MVRPGVADAARVNAGWCEVVCRTGTFSTRVWKSASRTPPLYPDAVTLAPDATVSEVLFEATWITRTADVPLEPGWARVGDPFDDPSVAVWSNGVAGVTANRDGGFAGLSNLYTQGDLDEAWRGATSAVAASFPGLPITGYERGEDLDAALRNGYTALGPLRVWLK
ncbi:hypothetical protein AB0E55_30380 [Amycolatopsis keratiniphila]|uniref:hypothetical protein n=1 Tax=Amycolatopsis keratiniphila TaxID=129921 RepID=UPI0033D738D9